MRGGPQAGCCGAVGAAVSLPLSGHHILEGAAGPPNRLCFAVKGKGLTLSPTGFDTSAVTLDMAGAGGGPWVPRDPQSHPRGIAPRSVTVTPGGPRGRYLEGFVEEAAAAAVLQELVVLVDAAAGELAREVVPAGRGPPSPPLRHPAGHGCHPKRGRTFGDIPAGCGDAGHAGDGGSATPSGHPPCVLHDTAQPQVRTAAVPWERGQGLGCRLSHRQLGGTAGSPRCPRRAAGGGGYLLPCGACSTSCPRSAPASAPASPPWPPRCRTAWEGQGCHRRDPLVPSPLSRRLRSTHLVDASGVGGRADAPNKGSAAAAALKRLTPARKRTVGTGDSGARPRGGDAAAVLTRRGGRCHSAPPAPRAGT